jgi:hypothetical protein
MEWLKHKWFNDSACGIAVRGEQFLLAGWGQRVPVYLFIR